MTAARPLPTLLVIPTGIGCSIGGYAGDAEINRALFVLGDGVGIVQRRRNTCKLIKSA